MLENKNEYLKKLYFKLENMMCDDEYMSNDILDLALDIISQQKRVIAELNKEIIKLEDLIDIEKIKSVSTNVTEGYTVDDLRARNKERLNK